MKKTLLSVLLILCLIFQTAIPVNAKNESVTIDSCVLTTSSAVITGTTNAHAVMVRIKDDSKSIIALQSFAVSASGTFSASLEDISLTDGSAYTISVADYEGGAWTTTTATVGSTPEPTEEPTFGDVNEDNEINAKDVTMLRRYLAGGWNVEINMLNSDVNNDGEINAKDVTILRRYLAGGWGVQLGKS